MASLCWLRKTRHFLPMLVLLGQVTAVLIYVGNTALYSNPDLVYHVSNNPVATPSKAPLSTGTSDDKEENVRSSIERQLRQASVLFKSAMALSSSILRFVVVSDSEQLYHRLIKLTAGWPTRYQDRIRFQWQDVWYPPGRQDMRSMFRVCATERLFLPDMFPELDAAIYIDTDLVFLEPPEHLWNMFSKFNEVQLAAMAPCLYHYGTKRNKVPHYGRTGLNAGIMHMNLTRMKSFPDGGWTQANLKVFDKHQKAIKLADQDILNILFHKYPKFVYELGCEWNFRKFQCLGGSSSCPTVATKGVSILHGNALSFISNQEMKLQAVFEVWEDHVLGSPLSELLVQLQERLKNVTLHVPGSKCTSYPNIDRILTRQLQKHAYSILV